MAALSDAPGEPEDGQVASLRVDAAGLDCRSRAPGQRRHISAPTMEAEALIIFADGSSKPLVDVANLEAAADMLSVAQTSPELTAVEPTHAAASHAQTASQQLVASAAGAVAVPVLLSAAAVGDSVRKGDKMEQVLRPTPIATLAPALSARWRRRPELCSVSCLVRSSVGPPGNPV